MRSGVTLSMIADANSYISWQGDTYNILYSPVLEDGSIKLIETGREDIATLINSYADQCDMSIILARLAAGDASPLYARQGFYGDFSGCTYNHAEMLQTVIDAHNYFDHLPADVRAKFNDSFSAWFGSAGSPDWAKSMSSVSNPASNVDVAVPVQPDPSFVSTDQSVLSNNNAGVDAS